jgi:hypothetical protein
VGHVLFTSFPVFYVPTAVSHSLWVSFVFSFFSFFASGLIVPSRYFLYHVFFFNVGRTKYFMWASKPTVPKPAVSPGNAVLQSSDETPVNYRFSVNTSKVKFL